METKEMQMGKNEVEVFLFAGDLIPYIRDPKHFNKTYIVDKHSAKQGIKLTYNNQQCSYLPMAHTEQEIRKIIQFTTASKIT